MAEEKSKGAKKKTSSTKPEDEMKELMPIEFVLEDKDPDIACLKMTKEDLLLQGKQQFGEFFSKYEDQVPDVFYSFVLRSHNYTKVLAKRFFNYIEQVYNVPRTAFLLDISNLENFEISGILAQLEYSKKFADGGLLRVGVIEPRTLLRKALQWNIKIQKRKTPIKVFEFDHHCIDWCCFSKEKPKKKNQQKPT